MCARRWWSPGLRSACTRREGVCRLRDTLFSVLWFGRWLAFWIQQQVASKRVSVGSLGAHADFRCASCFAQLTEALKKKVNDKIGNALSKVSRKLTRCNGMLAARLNPHVK